MRQQLPAFSGNRFLRLPLVMAKTGLGRSSVYRLMATGAFPKSVSIGAQSVAWLEADVEAWITSRVSAANPASDL